MIFDTTKIEDDEYVFRIRNLLKKAAPGGLDLSKLEDLVKQEPDQDGELPTVTDATLKTRLNQAVLMLVIEGATIVDVAGGGKELRSGSSSVAPESQRRRQHQ